MEDLLEVGEVVGWFGCLGVPMGFLTVSGTQAGSVRLIRLLQLLLLLRLFGFIALDEASVSSGTSIAKGASSGLVALAAASGTSDDLGVSLVPPPMRGNQLIEAFRKLGDP